MPGPERRRWVRLSPLVLVVLALCLAGCSKEVSDTQRPSSGTYHPTDTTQSTSSPAATIPLVPTGGIVVPECDDEAACAAGFFLDDGIFYNLDCVVVGSRAVSEDVIGSGDLYGEDVSVNLVNETSRDFMVAVSNGGGFCSDEPTADWVIAYPEGVDNPSLLEVVCEIGELSAEQREANGC